MLVETDIAGFIIRFIIQGCHQKLVASQNLPSTYFLVLTWVQVQFCKNSYYFLSSNVSVSSKTDHTPLGDP